MPLEAPFLTVHGRAAMSFFDQDLSLLSSGATQEPQQVRHFWPIAQNAYYKTNRRFHRITDSG